MGHAHTHSIRGPPKVWDRGRDAHWPPPHRDRGVGGRHDRLHEQVLCLVFVFVVAVIVIVIVLIVFVITVITIMLSLLSLLSLLSSSTSSSSSSCFNLYSGLFCCVRRVCARAPVFVCVCVHACVLACVRACVCMCACVCACVCVRGSDGRDSGLNPNP